MRWATRTKNINTNSVSDGMKWELAQFLELHKGEDEEMARKKRKKNKHHARRLAKKKRQLIKKGYRHPKK